MAIAAVDQCDVIFFEQAQTTQFARNIHGRAKSAKASAEDNDVLLWHVNSIYRRRDVDTTDCITYNLIGIK